jgi:hypothetical protein
VWRASRIPSLLPAVLEEYKTVEQEYKTVEQEYKTVEQEYKTVEQKSLSDFSMPSN